MNLTQLKLLETVILAAKRYHRGDWELNGSYRWRMRDMNYQSKGSGVCMEGELRLITGLYHCARSYHHEHGGRSWMEPLTCVVSFIVSTVDARVLWGCNLGGGYHEDRYMLERIRHCYDVARNIANRSMECVEHFTPLGRGKEKS